MDYFTIMKLSKMSDFYIELSILTFCKDLFDFLSIDDLGL